MMAGTLLHGMSLTRLLDGLVNVPSACERQVQDLTLDSRAVVPGACFIALAGARDDGTRYAADAIARGALAVIADKPLAGLRPDVPVLCVPGLRGLLGELANRCFAAPSTALALCAVTGTNGKSSVAHLLTQAADLLGRGGGYIGTLGAGRLAALAPLANTTPDVLTINRWLAAFRDAGCGVAALEASSHALSQGRLDGLTLRAAAFTNLGHDHLDYHASLADYAAAKRRLFEQPGLGAAVLNVDDALGAELARELAARMPCWTTSSQNADARLRALDIDVTPAGMRFVLELDGVRHAVQSALAGRFNVDNLLTVSGLLRALGVAPADIVALLPRLRGVTGRAEECARTPRGARVFVDYAHSPDSLAAILATLRALGPRRIVLVFGCGGDRDRSKRPLMGAVAERDADLLFVTSDNPRSEAPATIAAEILAGLRAPAAAQVTLERAAAIRAALATAEADDIVLVAGKGHERTQEIAGRVLAFSDHAEIAQAIAEQRP
ncbi:MAG: UDP-N-acetylmuramoyl-L-alanyl-D-glutamate--2,6-diaminopimelate ligase [Gammaproteobacteria bacterium]